MTIDEAIKHSKEVAYQKDLESGFDTDNERYAMTDKERIACKECAKEHRQLAEWLEELKQLREQTRWIPVSERLPEQAGEYLVIYRTYHWGETFREHIRVGVDSFRGKTTWAKNKYQKVIAWMPLPKPYNAENEE